MALLKSKNVAQKLFVTKQFLSGLNKKFYVNVTGDNVIKTPISGELIQYTFLNFLLHTSRLARSLRTTKHDNKASRVFRVGV